MLLEFDKLQYHKVHIHARFEAEAHEADFDLEKVPKTLRKLQILAFLFSWCCVSSLHIWIVFNKQAFAPRQNVIMGKLELASLKMSKCVELPDKAQQMSAKCLIGFVILEYILRFLNLQILHFSMYLKFCFKTTLLKKVWHLFQFWFLHDNNLQTYFLNLEFKVQNINGTINVERITADTIVKSWKSDINIFGK